MSARQVLLFLTLLPAQGGNRGVSPAYIRVARRFRESKRAWVARLRKCR